MLGTLKLAHTKPLPSIAMYLGLANKIVIITCEACPLLQTLMHVYKTLIRVNPLMVKGTYLEHRR